MLHRHLGKYGSKLVSESKVMPKTTPPPSQFICAVCGHGFEQKSRLGRHMETSHPPSAPSAAAQVFSAATIAKVLSGIDFPKSKDGIKKYARNNLDNFGTKGQRQQKPEAVLDLLDRIPEKQYSNMAEVEREGSKGIVISFFLYCYFRFW